MKNFMVKKGKLPPEVYCTCTVYASQVKKSYIKQLDKFALAAYILFSPVSC
jgi:hypothetical protein